MTAKAALHPRDEPDAGAPPFELALPLFPRLGALFSCYPGGNPTYIVADPSILRADYSSANAAILARFKSFEQGGFLEHSDRGVVRLQMAGDEFCGNALRSVAALVVDDACNAQEHTSICDYSRLQRTDTGYVVPLEISGTESLLYAVVRAGADGFDGSVELPALSSLERVTAEALTWQGGKIPVVLVRLDGNTHIIIPERALPFE